MFDVEILNIVAIIVTIFSALFFIPLISEFWNRPRFAYGFLNQNPEITSRNLKAEPHKRLDLSKWKPKTSLKYLCKNNSVRVPMIVSNIGRGDVKDGMVLIEYWKRDFIVEEIHTEYLKVFVAFGSKDHFTSKPLWDKIPNDEIIEYYDSIGMKGNFLEFVGNLPAHTYEVILFDIHIIKPIKIKFKLSLRSPNRLFQQHSIEQEIEFIEEEESN